MKEEIKPKNLPEVNDRRKSSSPLVPGRRDFLGSIIFDGGVVIAEVSQAAQDNQRLAVD
ncbi:MAG: hypothetical protein ACETWC_06805 [Acidobacteriota bacterium]